MTMRPTPYCYIEPIIDFVNLRPFAEFVLHLTNRRLSSEAWEQLLRGVLSSNVEEGARFDFNLTPDVERTYATFAGERGRDFHKVHVQMHCHDWIAMKACTAAEIMSLYKLEPLSG